MQIQNLFYTICGVFFSMLFCSCVVASDPNSGGDGPHIRIEPGVDVDWGSKAYTVGHNDYFLLKDTVSVFDTVVLAPQTNYLTHINIPFDSLIVCVTIGKTIIPKKDIITYPMEVLFAVPITTRSGLLQIVSKKVNSAAGFDTVGYQKLTIR